jgi:hypothetical protein
VAWDYCTIKKEPFYSLRGHLVIDLVSTGVAFTVTAANVDKCDVFKKKRPSACRHKRTFTDAKRTMEECPVAGQRFDLAPPSGAVGGHRPVGAGPCRADRHAARRSDPDPRRLRGAGQAGR